MIFFKTRMQNLDFVRLKEKLKYRKVYIWGADNKGEWIENLLLKNGIEVEGFLDSIISEKEGMSIQCPEKVINTDNRETSYIIISMMLGHQETVCALLRKNGFVEMEDYYFPYKDWSFAFYDLGKRMNDAKQIIFDRGKELALQLNPNKLYFLLFGYHIGDEIWMLSLLGAFKKRHFIKEISVLTSSSFVQLANLYAEDIEELIVWEDNKLQALQVYSSNINRKTYNIIGANYIGFPQERLIPFPMNRITYKTMHLGLPYNIKSKYFKSVRNQNLVREFIDKNHLGDKSILLVPYARTCQMLPESFWEKLVNKLSDLYVLYTNVNEHETAIKGTIPIKIPLEILAAVVKHIGCAITIRCGIADVLALGECENVVVIYNIIDDIERNYVKTNQLYINDKESILYKNSMIIDSEHDEDKTIDDVIHELGQLL